jgi:hypothetical protein
MVATVIPLVLFSVSQVRWGTTAAVATTATWTLGATLIEAACRRRVSGLLILSLLMLTVKSAGGLATGSSFLFFAVPCGGTAALGAMFAWSANWKSPLIVRLAHDVVPFMSGHLAAASSRAFVLRLSWTWGVAYLANALATLALLLTTPLHAFLVLHVAAGWLCTGLAGAVTLVFARRHVPHVLRSLRSPSGQEPSSAESGEATEGEAPTLAA